jgi:adenylylsulfate kinase
VVWFTGLPSSGKTSLAEAVRQRLLVQGFACCLLDGDAVRGAVQPRFGYTPEERDDFYATLGGLSALLAKQGLVVLTAATAPEKKHREQGRSEGAGFVEVYVDTPPAECERRDAKGLYAKARKGLIRDFPGIGAAYERPEAPDVTAAGGRNDAAVAAVCFAIGEAREWASPASEATRAPAPQPPP